MKKNPKKSRGILCSGNQVKYAFIRENMATYSIEILCEVLEVSRGCYYVWQQGGISSKEKANEELLDKIKETHSSSRSIYGYRRVYQVLRPSVNCSENRG